MRPAGWLKVRSADPVKFHAGFSLIELVIVMAIAGMLMVLGIPGFATWLQNTRVRTAAESVHAGLQLGRTEALKRNTSVSMVISADTSWSVGCTVSTAACPAVIQQRTASEASTGTSAVVGNATVANTVIYNNLGALVNPAGGMTVDVDSTVLSAADSRNLRIQIGISGATRLCDPTVADGQDPRHC